MNAIAPRNVRIFPSSSVAAVAAHTRRATLPGSLLEANIGYGNEGMCSKPVGLLAVLHSAVQPRQHSGPAWRMARHKDHSHPTCWARKSVFFLFFFIRADN